MTNKPIILDNGSTEYQTQIHSPHGSTPEAGYVYSPALESVGELAARVYGFNNSETRGKITSANTSINGLVRIPN